MGLRRSLSATLLALGVLGPSAAHAATVRSIPGAGDTQVLAVDATASGAVGTLYSRRTGDGSALHLRTATADRVIDRSGGSYEARLAHGPRGFLVLFDTVRSARGVRHAFVWEDGGVAALPTGANSVFGVALSENPGGAVVAAVASREGVRTFRRQAGQTSFAAPQLVGDARAFIPRTAISRDGEAVVAWSSTGALDVVRAPAGTPFPAAVSLAGPRTQLGGVAITDGGLVVLAGRTITHLFSPPTSSSSVYATWPRGGTATALQALSPAGRRGSAASVLATGDSAFLAWRDLATDGTGARLGVARVDGSGAVSTVRSLGAGSGTSSTGVAALARWGRSGVRVYVGPYRGTLTRRTVDAELHPGRVERVSPRGERIASVSATTSHGRPIAAWSTAALYGHAATGRIAVG